MKSRIFLIVTTIFLVICLSPMAFAEVDFVESEMETTDNSDVLPVSSEVYVDFSQATLLLRDMLVARESEATIYVSSGSELTTTDLHNMYNAAISHTGNPKEGDYIKANTSGCSFSISTSYTNGAYYHTCTFTPYWLSNAEQEAQVDVEIEKLLAELNLWNASNYEKVKGVYDWVTENVQYDFDNEDDDTYMLKHSTYAAIVNRVAVCQGYASLYYRLMLELGVDCRYISGITEGESHGWNIVYLDGKYYNVDSTWDRDLMGHYRYFLCTEANFTSHVRDAQFDTEAFHASYPMAVVPYVFNVTASGNVNAYISWVLDGETGTLTVAGSGAIPSYRYSYAPWYDYRESVKSIVISEGITEVGERAFYWSTNCTSVSLPSTLTAIREYGFNNLRALQTITLPKNLKTLEFCAFSECVALKSIVLPDSVTNVGPSVFSNCTGLTSAILSNGMTTVPNSMFFNDPKLRTVVLPANVTYIGDTAFHSTGLREVTIPATLTSMGSSVFAECPYLRSFNVQEGNPSYKSVDGVLFTADSKTLLSYPAGKYGPYTVPEGTITIARSAFRGSTNLTGIQFGSTLKTIEGYAFSYCIGIYQVTFPSNVTRICDSAFRSCINLKTITFQNQSVTLESGGVFAECDSLVSITLPTRITEIPGYLFYGCARLRNVTIPSTARSIGSSAFLDCDSLQTITIPGSVRSIGRQAFDFCNSLQTITIQEGTTKLDDYCIRNAPSLTKVVIPNSVTSIGKECFDLCPNVTLYVNCGTTGHQFARNNKISYTASHPYTVQRTVSPTCTVQGYTLNQCACGDFSYQTNITPAKGHNYRTTVTSPTCTTNGYTHYLCTVCGYAYDGDMISAPGHTMVSENYKAPTCTENGYSGEGSCQVCGVHLSDGQVIPATGHSMEEWIIITAASCTQDGKQERTCTRCDYTETQPISATGHDFGEWRVIKQPVCVINGTEQRSCAKCNLTEQRDITATGHDWHTKIIPPTCTEPGYSSRTCTYCSSNYTDVNAQPLGHNYGTWIINSAPSCLNNGSQMHQCTRCRNWEYETIPALGHEFRTTVIDPTCTAEGYSFHECSRCDYSYQDTTISPLGHAFVDGVCTVCAMEDPDYVLIGDLDRDGEISDWDAILLNRYMAGWKVEIDPVAADIDGDGEITDWDAILLDRYMAGWQDILRL